MEVSKDEFGDWCATFEVQELEIPTHLLACRLSVRAGFRESLICKIDSSSPDRNVLDQQLIALSVFWRDDLDLMSGVKKDD